MLLLPRRPGQVDEAVIIQVNTGTQNIEDSLTSLIFRAFEATMSSDWINRTQPGESFLKSSSDSDSIIFVIWLREYNDCKSRARGGPAEKVTIAATFKCRVIFADTLCDLTGSWRSICTSIRRFIQNGTTQKGTCNNMLTLMPGNVPQITNDFANNMIGSRISVFAIQLQRQSRGSICSTSRVIKSRSEIIPTRQQLGTYKIKLSSQSCGPFFASHSEVSSFILSNSNLTQ